MTDNTTMGKDTISDTEGRTIPKAITEHLNSWKWNWHFANFIHYLVGVIGIFCSSMAAASIGQDYHLPSIAGVLSAVCFGILGFVRPRENYDKYVRAWRHLDGVALAYRYGRAGLDDLVQAVKEGNNLMTDFEQTQNVPIRPEAQREPDQNPPAG